MSTAKTLAKLNAYKKNPEVFQSLSNEEMADLVIVVLSQVNTIDKAIKEGRLDGKTPIKDQEYLGKDTALNIIKKGLDEASTALKNDVDNAIESISLKGQELDQRVAESIARLRDGDDGVVTDEEIERAASVALEMLELPDFDSLISEQINTNSESIRNALELLTGKDRYQVEIADVKGLGEALNQLSQLRTANGGTIGKQQVYGFIRQAITDGTITSGGSSLPDQTGNSGKFLTTDGVDASWGTPAGSGDVVGPASAVDSNFAAFDTTTGKLIKDSGVTTSTFATAAQGALADTAVQPAAIDSKLDDLSAGTADAIVTASADGTLLSRAAYTIASLLSAAWDRASHTGTQLASTISDFASAAIAAVTWSTITGKPSTFAPSAHASSHATAGSDPIAPGDIGAQATLVSGTNIKTINSTSLLGSGDIAISATPAGPSNELQRNNGGTFAGATGVTWASNQLLITAQSAAVVPFAVKGATSHTAALSSWQNSSGSELFGIRADGALMLQDSGAAHPPTIRAAISGYGGAGAIYFGGRTARETTIGMSWTGNNGSVHVSSAFWFSGSNDALATPVAGLAKIGTGIIGVRGASTTAGGTLSFIEQTAPSAPATNGVYIYAEDNGSGKTRLMALFATGAAQQIAIEP